MPVGEVAETNAETTIVFAYADKTMLRISGLSVHGLDAGRLEKIVAEKLNSPARVIGVTGQSIDMDVYGLKEENILRDEKNLIQAIALAEGITLTDLAGIACSGKAVVADLAAVANPSGSYCPGERWKYAP
jgi:hypothetical protein